MYLLMIFTTLTSHLCLRLDPAKAIVDLEEAILVPTVATAPKQQTRVLDTFMLNGMPWMS